MSSRECWQGCGHDSCFPCLQGPDEVFGMNVAGGIGCQNGDLPVFISALRPDSVVARSGKVQVRTRTVPL